MRRTEVALASQRQQVCLRCGVLDEAERLLPCMQRKLVLHGSHTPVSLVHALSCCRMYRKISSISVRSDMTAAGRAQARVQRWPSWVGQDWPSCCLMRQGGEASPPWQHGQLLGICSRDIVSMWCSM